MAILELVPQRQFSDHDVLEVIASDASWEMMESDDFDDDFDDFDEDDFDDDFDDDFEEEDDFDNAGLTDVGDEEEDFEEELDE